MTFVPRVPSNLLAPARRTPNLKDKESSVRPVSRRPEQSFSFCCKPAGLGERHEGGKYLIYGTESTLQNERLTPLWGRGVPPLPVFGVSQGEVGESSG